MKGLSGNDEKQRLGPSRASSVQVMARGEGWLTRSTGSLMIIALDPVLKYTPCDLRRHGLDTWWTKAPSLWDSGQTARAFTHLLT